MPRANPSAWGVSGVVPEPVDAVPGWSLSLSKGHPGAGASTSSASGRRGSASGHRAQHPAVGTQHPAVGTQHPAARGSASGRRGSASGRRGSARVQSQLIKYQRITFHPVLTPTIFLGVQHAPVLTPSIFGPVQYARKNNSLIYNQLRNTPC